MEFFEILGILGGLLNLWDKIYHEILKYCEGGKNDRNKTISAS